MSIKTTRLREQPYSPESLHNYTDVVLVERTNGWGEKSMLAFSSISLREKYWPLSFFLVDTTGEWTVTRQHINSWNRVDMQEQCCRLLAGEAVESLGGTYRIIDTN